MAEVNAAGREGGRRREGGEGITPLFKALSLTTQQIFSTIYLSSL